MDLKIQCFGVACEICGGDFIDISLATGSNVGDLKTVLTTQYPALGELRHFFIARNQAYAKADEAISIDDELVIIPPVSGG